MIVTISRVLVDLLHPPGSEQRSVTTFDCLGNKLSFFRPASVSFFGSLTRPSNSSS